MTRPLRIQYEGAVYHITCRGNERRYIFQDEADRKKFLNLLKDSLKTYQIVLYCYVLMDNHFHLLLETPLSNLSEFMRQFNIIYTSYYNRRYKRAGNLYQGRYKSIIVDKDNYLAALSRYIHLNPVRVKEIENKPLSEKEKYLRKYKWSSLLGYIDVDKRESFVDYETILGAYSGDSSIGRDVHWKDVQSDVSKGIDIKERIIGGSILGSDKFISWIKEKFSGREMREIPSLRTALRYKKKDEIIKILCKETGKSFDEIIKKKGTLRQVGMELLYRVGGLKGREIGEMMDVDYSTVSQGRKRLREKLSKNKSLCLFMDKIEGGLSI